MRAKDAEDLLITKAPYKMSSKRAPSSARRKGWNRSMRRTVRRSTRNSGAGARRAIAFWAWRSVVSKVGRPLAGKTRSISPSRASCFSSTRQSKASTETLADARPPRHRGQGHLRRQPLRRRASRPGGRLARRQDHDRRGAVATDEERAVRARAAHRPLRRDRSQPEGAHRRGLATARPCRRLSRRRHQRRAGPARGRHRHLRRHRRRRGPRGRRHHPSQAGPGRARCAASTTAARPSPTR